MLPEEVPFYAATDERVVEMQGEAVKVLKALEAVVGHLRKFLVDHSVLPLFEKTVSPVSIMSIDIFLFQCDVVIIVLYNFSTTQQSLKSVKWRPGLTSHHCILHFKVELALSTHPQQGGNLCTWSMNHNWSHVLDTLEFHSMDKTPQFQ